MNSRWQANKIGFINFWYYDEQEFPFVKGRMLLRDLMELENRLPCRVLFLYY